jgi:hypothetical protein
MAEGAVSDVTVEITKQSQESSVGRLATILHLGFQQQDQSNQERPTKCVRFVQRQASHWKGHKEIH